MIFRGFLGLILFLASASAGGYGPGGSLGGISPSARGIAGRQEFPGIGLSGQGSVAPGAGNIAGRNVPGADQRTLIAGGLTSEGVGGRFGVPGGISGGSSAATFGGRPSVPGGVGVGSSAPSFGGRPGVTSGLGVGPSAASFGGRPGVPSGLGVRPSAASFGGTAGLSGGAGVGPSTASFGGRPGVPGVMGVGPSAANFGGRPGAPGGMGVGQSGFVPYGPGASGVGGAGFRVTPGAGIDGGVGGENLAPKPFGFEYQTVDEQGNIQFRQEAGDVSGSVQGTYGYVDTQGLYRQVQYLADAGGFRAIVQTNEPGTDGKESPADVQMVVEQTPAGVQPQFGSGGPAGSYGTTSGIPVGSIATGVGGRLGPQIGTLPGRSGISTGPGGVPVTGGVSGLGPQGFLGGIGSQVMPGVGGTQDGGRLVGGSFLPAGGIGSSVYGVPTGLTTGGQGLGIAVGGLPGVMGQNAIGGFRQTGAGNIVGGQGLGRLGESTGKSINRLGTGTGLPNILGGNLFGSGGVGSTVGLGAGQGVKSGKSGY